MATVIVLYGPKAVGKSWVAQALVDRLGVRHVDVDALVLDLLAAGVRPDPADGWLAWVEQRVVAALDTHPLVSVEATGAWDSDWRLADDLEARGVRVLRVWVSAPQARHAAAAGRPNRPTGAGVDGGGRLDLRPGHDPGRRSAPGRADRHRQAARSGVGGRGAAATPRLGPPAGGPSAARRARCRRRRARSGA